MGLTREGIEISNNDLKDSLLRELEKIKGKLEQKQSKKLELDLMEKLVNKLLLLSEECDECSKHLHDLEKQIFSIKKTKGSFESYDVKKHSSKLKTIRSHLQKKHKMVTEGYYMGLYMSHGFSFGLLYGVIFDNIALGMVMGLPIGLSIGVALDADAKKKGLVI